MEYNSEQQSKYVKRISESGLTIYNPIDRDNEYYWLQDSVLEDLLNKGLYGFSVYGLPIRRRSKVIKEEICKILGYPVPSKFIKTKPRFPGQDFDTYIQKSNNLQIWNEDISPTRRYVIIQVSSEDVIKQVKVVTGAEIAPLDTTGTLTRKFQARVSFGNEKTELVTSLDTSNLLPLLQHTPFPIIYSCSPTDYPRDSNLLPIGEIYKRLCSLVGLSFPDIGYDQERLRGAQLHQFVSAQLGYQCYHDDGRFPDIRNQLVEVKLQLSPTIDLGLVCPDSQEPLIIPKVHGIQVRHCDVRYAIFCGHIESGNVIITHFYLSTGESFFTRFTQFQGMVSNAKIQIPLPPDFFDR